MRTAGLRESRCGRNMTSGAMGLLHQRQARVQQREGSDRGSEQWPAAWCPYCPPMVFSEPCPQSLHCWVLFSPLGPFSVVFPVGLLLGLSFCTDLQCGGPRLAEPLVQPMGMRPGPESQASLGTSALRVCLFQSSEAGLPSGSGVLENYLAGVWTEGQSRQRTKGLGAEPVLGLVQLVSAESG